VDAFQGGAKPGLQYEDKRTVLSKISPGEVLLWLLLRRRVG